MGLESELGRTIKSGNLRAHIELANRLGLPRPVDDDDGSLKPLVFRIHFQSGGRGPMWSLRILGLTNGRHRSPSVFVFKTGTLWSANFNITGYIDDEMSQWAVGNSAEDAIQKALSHLGPEFWGNTRIEIHGA